MDVKASDSYRFERSNIGRGAKNTQKIYGDGLTIVFNKTVPY